MEDLKRVRRLLRRQFEKLYAELEGIIGQEEPNREELEVKFRLFEDNCDALMKNDEKIMTEVTKLKDDETENTEFDEMMGFRARAEALRVKKDKLSELSVEVGTAESLGGTTLNPGQFRKFNLPPVTVKKFSGDLKDWLAFWSQFQKVDLDPTLDGSDKLFYLVQALEPNTDASKIASGYPLTSENYPKVVEALKRRYGNEDLLLQVYIREILNIVTGKANSRDKLSIKDLFLTLESHLRALRSLNLKNADPESWLFPLVESCLSEDVQSLWHRSSFSTKDGSQENPPRTRLDYLMEFLEREVDIGQKIDLSRNFAAQQGKEKPTRQDRPQQREPIKRKHNSPLLSSFPVTNRQDKCVFCGKTNHFSGECFKAQTLSAEEINGILRANHLCFRCCGRHLRRSCDWSGKCSNCKGNHIRARCPQKTTATSGLNPTPPKRARTEAVPTTSTSNANLECSEDVALQTVRVQISDGKQNHQLRAFIDSGSQHSYILKSVAQRLSLEPVAYERVVHSTFGARTMEACHGKYEVSLKSLTGDYEVGIQLRDNVKICGRIPNIAGKRPLIASELKAKGIFLNDVASRSSEVDLLIGADVYAKILTGNVVHLDCGAVAINTKVGWTLMGSVEPEAGRNQAAVALSMAVTDASVTQLWDMELLGITDPTMELKKKEKLELVKEEFAKNISRLEDGRYSVKLPWKDFRSQLPHNRAGALRRLLSASKRLVSLNLFKTYSEIFKAWEQEGIIERVNPRELVNIHYVPHRPVVKLESKTTPVRPVFDALTSGLNSYLEKGENYVQLLPHILYRFRLKDIGFIADIRKAFLMIEVDRADRDFMRFLWWKDEKMEEIIEYRHARVMFGAVCSPFILAVVLQQHLSSLKGELAELGEKLLDSIYVDNCVCSVESINEYSEFREKSIEILKEAKMDLRLWMSNVDGFDEENDEIVSVLGIMWDRKKDEIFINVKGLTTPDKITKRKILATVQKLFDPIGLITPAVLKMKLLLQQTWISGMKWDDCLPEKEANVFLKWCEEIREIEKLRIPRVMTGGKKLKWQFHTFVDASQDAYATVIFLRSEDEDGNISVNLVASKSRVAPIKKDKSKKHATVRKLLTIPKLELMGCVIGARLALDIGKALKLDKIQKFFWSDSTTALTWISKPGQWNTFVANRCDEINKLTNLNDWRFVPGNLNPADLPSRGCSPANFVKSQWWLGPEFLYSDDTAWPTSHSEINESEIMAERKKSVTVMSLYDCLRNQYKYKSMVKITAWVRRFLHNYLIKDKNLILSGPLTDVEIEKAEKVFLREIQREEFPPEDRSKLKNLEYVIDEWGLLRVKTRLTLLDELNDFKYHIVLPSDRPEIKQLINDEHFNNCHAGAGTLLTILRKRFWLLNGRKTINSATWHCYRCGRYTAKPGLPAPAPLPVDRVKDSEVFEVVGIDLAGPLLLKNGKKVWLVLFTCAVYRAVHIEIVTTQSTRGFLNSLDKFIKKYRRPATIYSDNGGNFRGASNLFDKIDWKEVEQYYINIDKINWRFNPVYSAWWGGWWERLIRSAKDLLKRMVGKGSLNMKELEYAVGAIRDTMNERPLTYVSEDVNDLTPLTPSMFLHPLGNAVFPEGEMTEAERLRFRYKYMKTLQRELKDRARREYLSMLVNRPKKKQVREPRVGQLVLVGSDDKKRLNWPLGKVLKLIPGKDGVNRLAEVKVQNGVIIRPLQRLFALEMDKCSTERNEVVTRNGSKVKIPMQRM